MMRSPLLLPLLLLLLLLLLLRNSKAGVPATSVANITVSSGETVRLSADLTTAERERLHDLSWQHPNGQLSLRSGQNTGEGGRYELLADGSLSFSHVKTQDSGKYSMRAFAKDGTRIKTKEILLWVKSGSRSGGSNAAVVALTICCFLLLSFILSYFIVQRMRRRRRRRRRREERRRTKAAQENVYMAMSPSNRKEEETYCALFNHAGSTESPVTPQDSAEVEGISA